MKRLRYHEETDSWSLETRHSDEVAADYTRRWLAWLEDEVAERVPRTVRVTVEGGPVLWRRDTSMDEGRRRVWDGEA